MNSKLIREMFEEKERMEKASMSDRIEKTILLFDTINNEIRKVGGKHFTWEEFQRMSVVEFITMLAPNIKQLNINFS